MLLTDLLRRGPQAISPTAHYTGYVWAHHGLGDKALATREGWVTYHAGQAAMLPVDLLGGPTLEHFLLARHRVMDHLLTEAVKSGQVGQVVELAAGMSRRGLTYTREYADLTYVEVDLPAMADRKAGALARLGSLGPRHRVERADVFAGDGLARVFAGLDAGVGTAVITEGLLNYFPTPAVQDLWTRVADGLGRFPTGLYLSDLHVQAGHGVAERAFAAALSVAVRGRVHLHFDGVRAAEQALRDAGFDTGTLHAPAAYADRLPGMLAAGAGKVHVVEARVNPDS